MKRLIEIIAVIIFGIALYSCEDSLGYDPHVTVSEIVKDTTVVIPEDTTKNTVFEVDSVRAFFKEHVKMRNSFIEFPWPGRTISKNIKIDTSYKNTILWLNWEVESELNDADYGGTGRMDRVSKFELIFEAKLDSRNYDLNISRDTRRWFKIEFRRMNNQTYYNVPSEYIRCQMFVLSDNKKSGILTMMFVADFEPGLPLQVKRFDGIIEIFY